MANTGHATPADDTAERFRRLIDIGISLSAERDHDRLMETILLEAKDMCNADGGTLYLRTEDDCLKFEIMRTDSLNLAKGGTTGETIPFPPVRIYDAETGEANHKNIASHAALTGRSVNIPDAYVAEDFDFSGPKKFDEGTGYRSKSFLTVPLKNRDGDVIGVLQLLNAQDRETGAVIPFALGIQPFVEALASQAAVALDNEQLLNAQRVLLDSVIRLIASAIDAKSPYTGGHCQRVPELTRMLAEAACRSTDAPFADFDLTPADWYELHIASWLHDCGKVTTPEYVVDKATKLETIYDRIHEIRTRFELVKRDAVIGYLKVLLDGRDAETMGPDLEEKLAQLDDDFAFIAECNIGSEAMAPDKVERVKRIAEVTWTRTLDDRLGVGPMERPRKDRSPAPTLPVEEHLLADKEEHIVHRDAKAIDAGYAPFGFKLAVPEHEYNLGEIYNLCVTKGTLTEEERFKINDHIVQTIVMLERLPFPKHLQRVPEYAGGHHETMDGTGYPRGLRKEEMSIPARIMAIADIFEALTAADRPYKTPKKLSESVSIMHAMKEKQHIDGDLFELFLKSDIYKDYAVKFLEPGQIDEVAVEQYLNVGGG
jgi:HD-GYP domain-containing protein (c-di-GMP phosphodiesterase class II)